MRVPHTVTLRYEVNRNRYRYRFDRGSMIVDQDTGGTNLRELRRVLEHAASTARFLGVKSDSVSVRLDSVPNTAGYTTSVSAEFDGER